MLKAIDQILCALYMKKKLMKYNDSAADKADMMSMTHLIDRFTLLVVLIWPQLLL